jgi:hypothetical protein
VDLRNSIGGCLTISNPDMVAGFNPAVFSWLLGKVVWRHGAFLDSDQRQVIAFNDSLND